MALSICRLFGLEVGFDNHPPAPIFKSLAVAPAWGFEHAMGTGKQNGPDYLPKLREEIIAVIRKYVAVSDNDVNFQVEKSDDYDMLELNITLPDK